MKIDFDRLLMFDNYMIMDFKNILENDYFCGAIKHLFVTNKKNLNKEIIKCYDNTKKFIKNKLGDNIKYLNAMKQGMKTHLNILINSKIDNYFDSMLENASYEKFNGNIKQFIDMFWDIPGCSAQVAEMYRLHILKKGLNCIQQSKQRKECNDHEFIQSLFSLHDKFSKITKNEMQQEPIYHKAFKEAFEGFINKEYYTIQLLGRFANDVLKLGSKFVEVSNLESIMDHIVMLYGCIWDKVC